MAQCSATAIGRALHYHLNRLWPVSKTQYICSLVLTDKSLMSHSIGKKSHLDQNINIYTYVEIQQSNNADDRLSRHLKKMRRFCACPLKLTFLVTCSLICFFCFTLMSLVCIVYASTEVWISSAFSSKNNTLYRILLRIDHDNDMRTGLGVECWYLGRWRAFVLVITWAQVLNKTSDIANTEMSQGQS